MPAACAASSFTSLGSRMKAAASLRDALGVGGREQQRLALLRALLGDRGDVVEEAHVEHAVGLVEHQRVQRLQVQAAALEVVHHPAGRAHHDVRAMLQAGQLRAHRGAAAQRQHLDVVFGSGQAPHLLRHLLGQFARRAQHQRLHGEAAHVQVGQQRQREGRRLAAAGLGLRDQVVPGQRQRQAGGLDRRHGGVAQALQVRERVRGQRQAAEIAARFACFDAGRRNRRVHRRLSGPCRRACFPSPATPNACRRTSARTRWRASAMPCTTCRRWSSRPTTWPRRMPISRPTSTSSA